MGGIAAILTFPIEDEEMEDDEEDEEQVEDGAEDATA